MLRRSRTNPRSSVLYNQESKDHLLDIADVAVETCIKEEEDDYIGIQIAGDLKENITVVAWKTIMYRHAIFSSNSGKHFSTWEWILMRDRRGRRTSRKKPIQNRNFVRSLQDAGFIPYLEADKDIFLDIVEGEQEVFTPTTDGQ